MSFTEQRGEIQPVGTEKAPVRPEPVVVVRVRLDEKRKQCAPVLLRVEQVVDDFADTERASSLRLCNLGRADQAVLPDSIERDAVLVCASTILAAGRTLRTKLSSAVA